MSDEHDPDAADESHGQAEFLDHQAHLAREALSRLRGEVAGALGRTADPVAWTVRYPWQSLGAAALAGLGAGMAMGRVTRQRRPAQSTDALDPSAHSADLPVEPQQASLGAAGRLLSGLGTVLGALASTVTVAASEAVAEAVKETIHDSLHPEPATHTNGHPDESEN